MNIFLKTTCIVLLTASISVAQSGKKTTAPKTLTKDQVSEIKKMAADFYKEQNYTKALEGYQALVGSDADNMDYNYRLGICYVNTNVNKPAAIEYLLKASTKKDCPNDSLHP